MRRFLVDNQLPAALARWISAQGEQAEHVLPLGLPQAFDPVFDRHGVAVGEIGCPAAMVVALLELRLANQVALAIVKRPIA